MLGILPYERLSQQRSSAAMDRGLNPYSNPSGQVSFQSPYYPSFTPHAPYVHPMNLRQSDSNQTDFMYSKMDYSKMSGYTGGQYPSPACFGLYGASPPSHPTSNVAPPIMNMFDSSPPFLYHSRFPRHLPGPTGDSRALETLSTPEQVSPLCGSGFRSVGSVEEREALPRHFDTVKGGRERLEPSAATSCSSGESSLLPSDEISSPEASGQCLNQELTASNLSSGVRASKNRSKKRPTAVPQELKDKHYWDKRKKNNESAKRSREARRNQEAILTKHLTKLEQEYVQLKSDIAMFSSELEQLRQYLMPHATYEQQQQLLKQYQQQQQQGHGVMLDQQQQQQQSSHQLTALRSALHAPMV